MVMNESYLDRGARVIVGIQMMALGLSRVVGGSLGIALILIGTMLVVTGILGRCLFYKWLGLSTFPRRRQSDRRG